MSAEAAEKAITVGALRLVRNLALVQYESTDTFLSSAIFHDPTNVDQRFPVPVLQCLQIKPLAANAQAGASAPERFRVVLSDLNNYVQCMLATQANHVVHDNLLERGSIVRVKQYQANLVKGKK
jgi:replication factor A1